MRAATAAASRYATFATFPALPRAEDRAPAAVSAESLGSLGSTLSTKEPGHTIPIISPFSRSRLLTGHSSSLRLPRPSLPSTSLYLHRLRSKITLKKGKLTQSPRLTEIVSPDRPNTSSSTKTKVCTAYALSSDILTALPIPSSTHPAASKKFRAQSTTAAHRAADFLAIPQNWFPTCARRAAQFRATTIRSPPRPRRAELV